MGVDGGQCTSVLNSTTVTDASGRACALSCAAQQVVGAADGDCTATFGQGCPAQYVWNSTGGAVLVSATCAVTPGPSWPYPTPAWSQVMPARFRGSFHSSFTPSFRLLAGLFRQRGPWAARVIRHGHNGRVRSGSGDVAA